MNKEKIDRIVELSTELKSYEDCLPDISNLYIAKYQHQIMSPFTFISTVQIELNDHFRPIIKMAIESRIEQIKKELESL